jgi:hypothetical protein
MTPNPQAEQVADAVREAIAGTPELWDRPTMLSDEQFEAVVKRVTAAIDAMRKGDAGTPSSRWAANGEPDPHGTHYDCERAALAMGDLTDDELANAVFLHGDTKPSMADLVSGKAMLPGAYLLAAKDRIRWLSRKLASLPPPPEKQA